MDTPNLSRRAHVVLTGLLGYIAFLAAYVLRFRFLTGTDQYGFGAYHLLAITGGIVHSLLYSLFFYPQMNLSRRLGKQIQRTMLCEALYMGLMLAAMFLLRLHNISRLCIFISGCTGVVLISLKHFFVVRLYAALHKSGAFQRSVLLIGEGSTAERYAETVLHDPETGHSIMALIASCDPKWGCPYRGGYDALETLLSETSPDEAVIALPASEYVRLDGIIALLEKYGVPLRIIPCYEERVSYQIVTSKFEDIQMIGIRDIPLNRLYNAFVKRTMDIALSLTALLILSPLMLLIALGVKLSTRDTVFFTQVRVGKNKRPFKMLKFRSMKTNSAENSAWSTKADDRRTFFGALIRKTSVDELPQLINVLRGDMSIVGPRPEIPRFVEQFRDEVPLYMIRHMVKPGITGLAQVSGYRGDTSIRGRIDCDIAYIENWTPWLDIRIMFRTLTALINDEQLPPLHVKTHR